MYYGNPPHVSGPDDRTMIQCLRCGWTSHEMTKAEYSALGVPHWCGNPQCDGIASKFVTYAPHECDEALSIMNTKSVPDAETRALIARNRLRWDIIRHASNPANWLETSDKP